MMVAPAHMVHSDWNSAPAPVLGRNGPDTTPYPYHARTFLMDESINKMRWSVTYESMKKQISSFVGKPAVMIPSLGHPPTNIQDAYKVGVISSVSLHANRRSSSALVSLTADAASLVSTGRVIHTSVQLSTRRDDLRVVNAGTPFEYEICDVWRGEHVALVASPAYGKKKAVIKRVCQGTATKCMTELPREADVNDTAIGQITIVPFVERALKRMYKPCTIEKVVSSAMPWHKIGRIAERHPDLTASQKVAMAIAEAEGFDKMMDSTISRYMHVLSLK